MAITTRDQLAAAMASATNAPFSKASITAVAGFYYSLFRSAAGMPAASAVTAPTTTGNTLDRTSSGALNIPSGGSNTLYITAAQIAGAVVGTLLIADRLVEYGGLSGITTGAQSVSAVTLPTRGNSGVGCELWLDVLTAVGATASATVTASYTNSGGTSGRTATLVGGIPASGGVVNRAYRFALQAGDVGVQSVQSFSSGTSTGTAGSLGLTIRKPLLMLPITLANVAAFLGYAETGLAQVPSDATSGACLELLVLATTTSTGALQGQLSVAQG